MSLPVVSWRVGADNDLFVKGATSDNGVTYPTDAAVTVTVRNRAGTPVTGLNGVTASYVAGTTGPDTAYKVHIDDLVTPPIGQYKAESIATKAGIVGREYAIILVEEG